MTRFSLELYFKRIHFRGTAKADIATVAAMMRCQLLTVPFENLDIQAGQVVSITSEDIVEKILMRQRGGYCYEVNGLFAMALDALRIPYIFVAARPLTHGAKKPKTHMALVVELGDERWLCDCGYGGHGIRAPMRLGALDTEIDQDGETFMLSQGGDQELRVKERVLDNWEMLYAFAWTPRNWDDFAEPNYYNSTHPESIFVRKLLVVLCTTTGRKILFGNRLKIVSDGQIEKKLLTPENRVAILREEFGLIEPESLLVS